MQKMTMSNAKFCKTLFGPMNVKNLFAASELFTLNLYLYHELLRNSESLRFRK